MIEQSKKRFVAETKQGLRNFLQKQKKSKMLVIEVSPAKYERFLVELE